MLGTKRYKAVIVGVLFLLLAVIIACGEEETAGYGYSRTGCYGSGSYADCGTSHSGRAHRGRNDGR